MFVGCFKHTSRNPDNNACKIVNKLRSINMFSIFIVNRFLKSNLGWVNPKIVLFFQFNWWKDIEMSLSSFEIKWIYGLLIVVNVLNDLILYHIFLLQQIWKKCLIATNFKVLFHHSTFFCAKNKTVLVYYVWWRLGKP